MGEIIKEVNAMYADIGKIIRYCRGDPKKAAALSAKAEKIYAERGVVPVRNEASFFAPVFPLAEMPDSTVAASILGACHKMTAIAAPGMKKKDESSLNKAVAFGNIACEKAGYDQTWTDCLCLTFAALAEIFYK